LLDGWRNQQLAWNLAFRTIEGRERAVRAFAAHADAFPWWWTPQLADEWCTGLRAVRGVRRWALRSYQEAVRLLCGYLALARCAFGIGMEASLTPIVIGQGTFHAGAPRVTRYRSAD
jgi:hypothetical protein